MLIKDPWERFQEQVEASANAAVDEPEEELPQGQQSWRLCYEQRLAVAQSAVQLLPE